MITGVVEMSHAAQQMIADCAATTFPLECCGVLIGRAGKQVEVTEAWATPNCSESSKSSRFFVRPADLYEHTLRARKMALDVVGFFHSHPRTEARPSRVDIRDASAWRGYVHAIYACSPQGSQPHLRAYLTQPASWRELSIKGAQK